MWLNNEDNRSYLSLKAALETFVEDALLIRNSVRMQYFRNFLDVFLIGQSSKWILRVLMGFTRGYFGAKTEILSLANEVPFHVNIKKNAQHFLLASEAVTIQDY